jgi:hypothetical protein
MLILLFLSAGLTPQRISVLGGFRAQGRTARAAVELVEEVVPNYMPFVLFVFPFLKDFILLIIAGQTFGGGWLRCYCY